MFSNSLKKKFFFNKMVFIHILTSLYITMKNYFSLFFRKLIKAYLYYYSMPKFKEEEENELIRYSD